MVIVPPGREGIKELLGALDDVPPAERDSAVAQLRLRGDAILPPLLAWLPRASPWARAAAVTVLEGSPDPRAAETVRKLLDDPAPEVARRAAESAAHFPDAAMVRALEHIKEPPDLRRAALASLVKLHGSGLVEALEPLLAVLLDEDEDEREDVRLICLAALEDLSPAERRPVLERLLGTTQIELARRVRAWLGPEARAAVASRATETPARAAVILIAEAARQGRAGVGAVLAAFEPAPPADESLTALAGELAECGEPAREAILAALEQADSLPVFIALAEIVAHGRAPAALPRLHELLGRLDARPDVPWALEAKAVVHEVLSRCNSRIALYDLRETLEGRPRAAWPRLLRAAARIGDASLVPPLVALAAEVPRAFIACADALRTLADREGLGARHRAFKNVRPEHQGALAALRKHWRKQKRKSRQ